jgi:hypothetical protein
MSAKHIFEPEMTVLTSLFPPVQEHSFASALAQISPLSPPRGPVERYPWPDHHPPPLSLMRVMTEGVKKWYLQDPSVMTRIKLNGGG